MSTTIFYFFKSIFSFFKSLVFLSLFLHFSLAYAQDNGPSSAENVETKENVPVLDAKDDVKQDDTKQEDEKGASGVLKFKDIRPVASEMEFIDPSYDKHYFDQIKSSVVKVKNELKSFREAVLARRLDVDRVSNLKSQQFYSFFSKIFIDYYEQLMPVFRNQYFLLRAEKLLADAEAVFEERKEIFPLVIEKEELLSVVYELKLLSALVNVFRGNERNLRSAVIDLEFILGDNEKKMVYISGADQETKKVDLYLYLVGIFDRLHQVKKSDHILSVKYLQKKLYYLWHVTIVKNAGNEELKNLKLKTLYNRYASIIDSNGYNYEVFYRPFGEDSFRSFKSLETKLLKKEDENAKSDSMNNPSGEENQQQKDLLNDDADANSKSTENNQDATGVEDIFQPAQ